MTLKQESVGLLLLLVSCSSNAEPAEPSTPAPEPDAAAPAAQGAPALLMKLELSRAAWDELVSVMGDTYYYEEENCLVNAPTATVSTVQVEDGEARMLASKEIAQDACMALVNRYAGIGPRTVPELYNDCETLVRGVGHKVAVLQDTRGLLRTCTWPGDDDCLDNCGEGFHLQALEFGKSPLVVP